MVKSLISRNQIQRTNNAIPQRGATSLQDAPFQIINGRLVSIEDNQFNYLRSGYDINDIIFSIIKLIMDKIKLAPWGVYDVKDEQALKQYNAIMSKKDFLLGDITKALHLRTKALEISNNPGKWGDLCKYPNEYETMPEFIANGSGYKLLLGNKYIWGDPLGAGANKGTPNELFNLPSQYMQIFCTDTFPTRIGGYNVQMWNQKFGVEEIMHEKYWNPNWNVNGVQLYGVAPLRAALRILNRDNSSLNSSAQSFQNSGISGILYMKNQVGQVDGNAVLPEVQELKKTMVTEWQGERNHGKMGLSGYEVGWLPVGMTAEEMQQIENEKWNMRRLCNVWGVSSEMMNDSENKKYSNFNEAEKALTARCALPELTSVRDNLNRKGRNDWGLPPGKIIDYDASVFSELNSSTKEMTEWMKNIPWLAPNQQLALLNLETIADPLFDEVWITQQMGQPFSEWGMNEVDAGLNDPNNAIE